MRAALVLLLLLVAAPLEAKNLYVNATGGSDATTYANNDANNPWATVGRAFWGSTNVNSQNASEAAAAGDVVYIMAGTYGSAQAVSPADEQAPLYNPANSGTAGNLITFKCVTTFVGAPDTDWGGCLLTASSHQGPVWGVNNRDYITLAGFAADEDQSNSTADTGPVVVVNAAHVIVRDCDVNGITTSFNDNHNAVRIEGSDDVLLANCQLYEINDIQGGENPAAVMLYTSTNVTIEYNTIRSGQNGIFVKGSNVGPVTIRRNLIHTQDRGIWIGGIGTGAGSDGAYIHENIVYGTNEGLSFISYDAVSPVQVRACNNTFHATTNTLAAPIRFVSSQISGLDDVIIHGNILYSGYNSITGEDQAGAAFATKAGPSPAALQIEHNVYFGASNSFSRIEYTNRNFATWKTFTGTDAASPASVESDPLFQDAASHDYRLQSGSPARMSVPDTCDIDGDANTSETKDAGARQFSDNASPIQIGHDASGASEPPADPQTPIRLRFVGWLRAWVGARG